MKVEILTFEPKLLSEYVDILCNEERCIKCTISRVVLEGTGKGTYHLISLLLPWSSRKIPSPVPVNREVELTPFFTYVEELI